MELTQDKGEERVVAEEQQGTQHGAQVHLSGTFAQQRQAGLLEQQEKEDVRT